ncbi:hypothetical protein LG943_23195 [Streptomonospora sp. S1-112]|uniref:Uncharacterized protein n=1 Tax=Streptomonospora mangrovi TaxID=2883123 RepID=A0A9X3NZJ2_9ACTN|nr:hypothetical protein [Streptomonospora mangrovi]MDA0567201.1 hypothetical protein [Streptomonospora mangrovi]
MRYAGSADMGDDEQETERAMYESGGEEPPGELSFDEVDDSRDTEEPDDLAGPREGGAAGGGGPADESDDAEDDEEIVFLPDEDGEAPESYFDSGS